MLNLRGAVICSGVRCLSNSARSDSARDIAGNTSPTSEPVQFSPLSNERTLPALPPHESPSEHRKPWEYRFLLRREQVPGVIECRSQAAMTSGRFRAEHRENQDCARPLEQAVISRQLGAMYENSTQDKYPPFL